MIYPYFHHALFIIIAYPKNCRKEIDPIDITQSHPGRADRVPNIQDGVQAGLIDV